MNRLFDFLWGALAVCFIVCLVGAVASTREGKRREACHAANGNTVVVDDTLSACVSGDVVRAAITIRPEGYREAEGKQ